MRGHDRRLKALEDAAATTDPIRRQLGRVLTWIRTGHVTAVSPPVIRDAIGCAETLLSGAGVLPRPEKVTLAHLAEAYDRGEDRLLGDFYLGDGWKNRQQAREDLEAGIITHERFDELERRGWPNLGPDATPAAWQPFASKVAALCGQYPPPPPPPRSEPGSVDRSYL